MLVACSESVSASRAACLPLCLRVMADLFVVCKVSLNTPLSATALTNKQVWGPCKEVDHIQ